jgi:hypothetical protein
MTLKRKVPKILIVMGVSLIGLIIYYVAWEVFEEVLTFFTNAEIHGETSFGWNFSLWELLTDFFAAFVVTALFITAYWYFIHRAEKERDKYRLMAYEHQLSPHFIFNSSNTLINLIEEDPTRATKFLTDISKLYRYTLSHLEHDSVSLQEELDFVKLYISIAKERFGDNLQVNMAPNLSTLQGSVPPVVLQLLIENAIKHNEHTSSHPLVIDVTGDDKYITVSNCKQPLDNVDSTHFGHKRIVGRYQLLTRKKVVIRETEKEYCVSIPLIHQKS